MSTVDKFSQRTVATKLQSADWCHCSVATADRALEIADSLV